MTSDPTFQRRLQMKNGEYRELLARLEMSDSDAAARRAGPRYGFQITDIPISIMQPEGGQARFLAYGRNLSAFGLSALHCGFIYPGSVCHVVLRQNVGSPIVVRGIVQHCRLIFGTCHEIGVRFDEEIDPASVPGITAERETFEGAPAALHSICGHVLYAESWRPSAALFAHHASTIGLEIESVTTSGQVLDRLRRGQPVDLLLTGLDLNTEDGHHAIREARAIAPDLPIIALIDDPRPEAASAAARAGATVTLARPVSFELLLAHLQAMIGTVAPLRRIYSTVNDLPGMGPLIGGYVHEVRRSMLSIDTLDGPEQDTALRTFAIRLRSTAEGYGYQDLVVAAILMLDALDHGDSAIHTYALRYLQRCCRALVGSAVANAA